MCPELMQIKERPEDALSFQPNEEVKAKARLQEAWVSVEELQHRAKL